MTIKIKQTTIILVSFLGLVYFTSFSRPSLNSNSNKNDNNNPREKIIIITKWQMPNCLNEISGICWVDQERIACVQDKQGIVFIYNISSAKIENQNGFIAKVKIENIND